MLDYKQALADVRFWDKDTDSFFRSNGAPIIDQALQNRLEIIELCKWIEKNNIRSYLEIGVWTGRLISALHAIFSFDTVAAVDLGDALDFGFEIHLPEETLFFEGDSQSPVYVNWRKRIEAIDLVFIDANHDYTAVVADFEVNKDLPNKYLAFHGIAGSPYVGVGVKKFWEELEGNKHEIILPHDDAGLEFSTMGIGIWSR